MAKIEFHNQGERRRLKAASTLVVIYGTTLGLHIAPWGSQVVLGLLVFMTVHSLRLILARSRVQPPCAPDWQPMVSILVAAKNEETVIAQLVECLCQLNYPSYDIWIVDDHSSDRTPEILTSLTHKYHQLHILRREADAKGGKSGALNQVLPLTQGEIIGVFDADAQLEPDALTQLMPLFCDPQVGAIQMRKSIANAAENFWTQGQQAEMALDIWLQQHRVGIGGIGELRGNGQFVRRTALQDCGGWNEQTITDDLDLTLKLHLTNWEIACALQPPVQEEGVITWKQLWHQRNRWAEGGYQRYLDYYLLLLNSNMGISKNFDLFLFLFNQYLLPIALVPDFVLAIAWQKSPVFSPVASLAFGLSFWGMVRGIQQAYQVSWGMAIFQTLRGAVYMLHWLPVMVSVTLRMAIRPKKLKWVKTLHQGLAQANSA
ncbi:MAG: glycosyltransferase family 2 protein [Pseudanabaenaceae cyanobacterium bins.68]|nr:glycosyltransferase family 2 protein [Pseudanabaenaceae cyanobacterium bins.68]